MHILIKILEWFIPRSVSMILLILNSNVTLFYFQDIDLAKDYKTENIQINSNHSNSENS